MAVRITPERDERNRAELLAALDETESDLESGEYTEHTNATIPQLATDLKREARTRREQSS